MVISTLLLDLDGTLYPNQNGIWEAIAGRMELYMEQVLKMDPVTIPAARQQFYLQYGTTLRGLQEHFDIDPYAYLEFVHDIPIHSLLKPDLELNAMLQNLPQEKWIFTNSNRAHALRVLRALGIENHFVDILDIVKMEFKNKPNPKVYQAALQYVGNKSPENCLFADDSSNNLGPAIEQGFHTVLVGAHSDPSGCPYHIHSIHQLPEILEQIENQ